MKYPPILDYGKIVKIVSFLDPWIPEIGKIFSLMFSEAKITKFDSSLRGV